MTPEFIAEKAKKYNMLPEDYYPMSLTNDGGAGGDYPVTVNEHMYNRPSEYEYDFPLFRKNLGVTKGFFEQTHYGRPNYRH